MFWIEQAQPGFFQFLSVLWGFFHWTDPTLELGVPDQKILEERGGEGTSKPAEG